jgi:hypothetical protein
MGRAEAQRSGTPEPDRSIAAPRATRRPSPASAGTQAVPLAASLLSHRDGLSPAGLLALQRTAGNAAVVSLFGRDGSLRQAEGAEADDRLSNPLTPNAQRMRPGAAVVQRATHEDTQKRAYELWERKRSPTQSKEDQDADYFEARRQLDAEEVERVASLEDIDGLSEAHMQAIDVKTSLAPYHVIHDVFHQSWHEVKKELLTASDRPGVTATRRALMKKLVDYREWHHQEILKEVKTELDRRMGKGALLPSTGAGSATLTSDIDVNLKGAHTELAVAAFNTVFKNPRTATIARQTWDFEPGVVYDVNVYAVDFMHEFGAVEQDGHRVTKKEGAHGGGIGGIRDTALADRDRRDQLATALFKNRLFMTQAEFYEYRSLSLRGLAKRDEIFMSGAFNDAEHRFRGYMGAMAEQMSGKAEEVVSTAESGVKQLQQRAEALVPAMEGVDPHATAAKREDVLMSAANRIYEAKLQLIHAQRQELANLISQLGTSEDGDTQLNEKIDQSVAAIRRAVSEAAMYANEASMTDATIHHGVVGIQAGKEIDQRKHEGLDALNEHLADVHKEAARYGEFGEGAYKAGKYLMRFGDAARNMGFGYVYGVQQLYDAGRQISVDIKNKADKGDYPTAQESAQVIEKSTGATTMAELLTFAREAAALVTQEYMQERTVETNAGNADTDVAFGHRTAKKNIANTNVINKGMVHPIKRGPDRGAEDSEMEKAQKEGKLDDFAFRLTQEELDALKEEWAAKKS